MSQNIDGHKVAQIFQAWAQRTYPVDSGAAVALDGKALASTVEDCHGHQQDYVTVVSACVQECGWMGHRPK